MAREIRYDSLRENTLTSIGNFLFGEQFITTEDVKQGILVLINLISDYKEEGQNLFPEVVVVNNLDIFKTITNREIPICEKELTIEEFKNVMKLCAPLAVGSWTIYVGVEAGIIKYGLIDAEMSETSPSIYEQLVGDMAVTDGNMRVVFLRNIGSKVVELTGLQGKLIVSLSLDEIIKEENDVVSDIAHEIVKECEDEFINPTLTYIRKTINSAIKQGHGNLIGVIQDSKESIEEIKKDLVDALYLPTPIDISDFVAFAEKEKNNESSVSLSAHGKIMIEMLNHDGITLFTNKGKILGYHMFIRSYLDGNEQSIGGARTRAFQSMQKSKLFNACFYKSQDGNSKFWRNND